MIKSKIKIILVFIIGLMLTQCSTYTVKKDMSQKGELTKTPKWYVKYSREDKNWMYETASSVSPDLELSIKKSTLLAKAKLADRIDGRLDSMTKSLVSQVGENVDASVITELERVSRNVIAEVDVAGYSRKELDVIASGNQFMAFVLLEYSDRAATKVYTNRLRKYKLFSDNLWDELDYETSAIIE